MPSWIPDVATGLGVLVAAVALIVSIRTSVRQSEADRRSFIFPLWEHINNVSHLDPREGKLIAEDARQALNALQLVAICWEGGIVNKKMIALTFGRTFLDLRDELADAAVVSPGYSASWKTMVTGNASIARVYTAIEKELVGKSPLG